MAPLSIILLVLAVVFTALNALEKLPLWPAVACLIALLMLGGIR